MTAIGSSFLQRLDAGAGLGSRYQALLDAISSQQSLPDRVQLLCEQRILQIHGCSPDGEVLNPDSDAEAIAVQLAEKMPFQHHAITDKEVESAREHFGSAGCVALLTHLAFCDVNCRLALSLQEKND